MLLFHIRNEAGTFDLNVASEKILVGGEHFYYGKIVSSSDITLKGRSPFGGFADYTLGNITLAKGTPVDNETKLLITAFVYDHTSDTRTMLAEMQGYYSSEDLDTITFTLFVTDPVDAVFQKDTWYSDTLGNVCSALALLISKTTVEIAWSCPTSIVDRQVKYYGKKGSSVIDAISILSANSCCISYIDGNKLVLISIHGGSRTAAQPIKRFFDLKKTGLITKSITANSETPCTGILLVENADNSTIHSSNKFVFDQSGTDFIISNLYINSVTPPACILSYRDFLTRKQVEIQVPATKDYHVGDLCFLPTDNNFNFIVTGIIYQATEDVCILQGTDARRSITKVGDVYSQSPLDCPDWSMTGYTSYTSTLTEPADGSTITDSKKLKLTWTDTGGVVSGIDILVKTNPGKVFVTHEVVCGSLAGYDATTNTWHYTMKFDFDPGTYDFEIHIYGVNIFQFRTVTFA